MLSQKAVVRIGGILMLIGVAPLICLMLWPLTHEIEPLSMRVPLKPGTYTSRNFSPDRGAQYQIDLDFGKDINPETEIKLHWQILDQGDNVVEQGARDDRIIPTEELRLGELRLDHSAKEKIQVSIDEGVQRDGSHATLKIEQPEVTLEIDEGYSPLAMGWAALVGLPGVILLAIGGRPRQSRNQASESEKQNRKGAHPNGQ